MAKTDRVPTGIPGLDKLVEGGFHKGSTVMVSGEVGTGKTTFLSQFLYDGLLSGETCMFISLEERPQEIIDDVSDFGINLQNYIDKKRLFLEYKDPFDVIDVKHEIVDMINKKKVSRVAIDSISAFGLYYKDPFEVRKNLMRLIDMLKTTGAVSVLSSEVIENSGKFSRFDVEEFLVDGVIVLRNIGLTGELGRSMRVRKLRRTAHSPNVHPMLIGKDGLKVKPTGRGIKL